VEGDVTTEVEESLCAGSFYNGIQIFSDTVLTTVLSTQTLGCDSTVTANIDVTELIETFDSANRCEGELFNGIAVFSDTTFVETFNLGSGCDSISTTEVTVFPAEETFLMESILSGEIFMVGNQVFDETGMYQVTLQTINGCDSLVYLDLSVLTSTNERWEEELKIEAFPNPFSETVNVHFILTKNEKVSLEIYDLNGRQMQTIFENKNLPAGLHQFKWKKEWMGSGVFYIRLRTETKFKTMKLVGL